jgi:asparagine synthase (glutamine-hydrolysing)
MNIRPNFLDARSKSKKYYTKSFLHMLSGTDNAENVFCKDIPWGDIPVEITRLIMQTYLSENGISQGDRLSMSNSIELRLPLVDYQLVETVIGLRRKYSDYRFTPKHWLIEATKDLLPIEIMKRPKRGFQPPVHEWHSGAFHKHGKLLVNGMLENHNILNSKACLELSTGPYPKHVVTPFSFKALVLELWARKMAAI